MQHPRKHRARSRELELELSGLSSSAPLQAARFILEGWKASPVGDPGSAFSTSRQASSSQKGVQEGRKGPSDLQDGAAQVVGAQKVKTGVGGIGDAVLGTPRNFLGTETCGGAVASVWPSRPRLLTGFLQPSCAA